jgi:hypothetical protein
VEDIVRNNAFVVGTNKKCGDFWVVPARLSVKGKLEAKLSVEK